MNMKKLKKGEKGFTLIELIIAILITGIVASAITGTILYALNVNFSTANRMTAVRQVRNVGFWVSPDVQMARCVYPGGSSGFPLALNWTDWANNDTHAVIYTLEDMSSGEFKVLKRKHYIESELASTTIVAEYIDQAETSCVWECDCDCYWEEGCSNWADAQLTFTVTASVGGQNETREYEVKPRPGSQ